MKKNILYIVFSIVLAIGFSGCTEDSETRSIDSVTVYSKSSLVDASLPKSMTANVGDTVTFTTKSTVVIRSYGDLNLDNVSYEDGNFSWEVQADDVGEHLLVLGDENNNTQDLTINVLSNIDVPSDYSASQGTYEDDIVIKFTHSYNDFNIYYSNKIDGTFILLESVESTSGSKSYTHSLSDEDKTLSMKYYYKVQSIDDNGNYSVKTDPFSGYVTIPTPSTINVYETKSINQLEVRWENINKNTSYNLYRS
ncbi:MAG: hypothetical protein U9O56_06985, partial [Campylobacterota bacterium]|nr:hypothetical protein [Campylobacterota bacterium]